MKTNQLMSVRIGDHELPIEHKTQMGSLKQLWDIGNSYRIKKGLTPMKLESYKLSEDLREFCYSVEMKLFGETEIKHWKDSEIIGGRAPNLANESRIITTKRGKSIGGTWAHLYILIDAATKLDTDFRADVFEVFIEGKILQHRDESGDAYKAMNIALDLAIEEVDRATRVARYRTLANTIADAVGIPEGDKRWNQATYEQLEKRTKLESSVTMVLRNNLIKDFEHLLDTIPNLAS